MILLKKRWRDTKDDHCKTTHYTIESKKISIIRWNISQQMVPYKITSKHSTKQNSVRHFRILGISDQPMEHVEWQLLQQES